MSNNYSLEIISHHDRFKGKSLRKYYVDGIDTVGAWGNEPFEIRFKNNSYQKIQVKISLDGTDILTGKPADTLTSSDMWVVNGYGTLNIKAWPETSNGGAGFVFTNAANGVAVHTHGDTSSLGIIAAAVFTESHVEPIKYYSVRTYPNIVFPNVYDVSASGHTFGSSGIISSTNNVSYNSSETYLSASSSNMKSLQSTASVGAGEHIDQKISYTAGLIKPLFTETIRVRYIWWDDLVDKLKTQTAAEAHASGFPGDTERKGIDLGNTPRIKSSFKRSDEVVQPSFVRV